MNNLGCALLGLESASEGITRLEDVMEPEHYKMTVEAKGAAGFVKGEGVLHFAIPAREWWNDIVFT